MYVTTFTKLSTVEKAVTESAYVHTATMRQLYTEEVYFTTVIFTSKFNTYM